MPKKNKTASPVTIEKEAEKEAQASTAEADEASAAVQNLDEEAEKGLIAEAAADADTATPAEVAALREDNESAEALNQDAPEGVKLVKKPAKAKKGEEKKAPPAPGHSPKHQAASKHIEKGKLYELGEAIELIKKASYSKFDGSVEVHLKLAKKKAKTSSESTKGIFQLPHGTGKTKNIAVLDEAKIEQIAKTKKIDFDIAVATPELMPKVGKIAKILGPRGLMPDPKLGTVTTDPKKAIDEINSGKIEYRIDAGNNIHQIVGKTSWDTAKLKENAAAVLDAFPASRIESAYLASTMSPSARLDLSSGK